MESCSARRRPTRSCCTACPRTAARRSPTTCSTARRARSSTRPRTGCTRRRRSWPGSYPRKDHECAAHQDGPPCADHGADPGPGGALADRAGRAAGGGRGTGDPGDPVARSGGAGRGEGPGYRRRAGRVRRAGRGCRSHAPGRAGTGAPGPAAARAAHRYRYQRQPGRPAYPARSGPVPGERPGPVRPTGGRRHHRRRRHHPRRGPRGRARRHQRPAAGGEAVQLGWQRRRERQMSERVVLAYSGGLDTSVAIPYLAERTGAEVIAVAVDVGQGGEDMEEIRERALACGAAEAEVVDARDEFAADFCLPALRANALYMDRSPLVSALSRPLIVGHLVAAARKHGGTIVSHGCTGKGNDQVRFEVGIGALAPDLKVVAPARDFAWTRDKAIGYAQEKGLPIDVTHKSPYSIDQNVWGRAVETGFLEDIWNAPIEDLYAYTADPATPRDPDTVVVTFDAGRPVALDGETRTPYQIITELNRRAGAQGVGRLDMVEDRLVGIKSREVYEAPAAIALIAAHQELESVTVERDVARFKRTVDQRWSELVYDGLWFSPLKKALDAFVEETQRQVTGEIRMTLHGGRATVTGRRSEASLYDFHLATYDTGDTFDQGLAKGFVQLWGMPTKLAAARDQRVGS